MNKRKIEYCLLLILFLVFLFKDSLDSLVIKHDKVLDTKIVEANEITRLKEENEELKKSLDFKENTNLEYVVSKVKFRNIYDYLNEVTIYKGSNDLIKKGDTVISNEGLIGFVKSTSKNEAIVQLITNKKSNVSVKINEAFGILKSENDKLIVSNISSYEKVEVNDKVYTSGLGNIVGNILVGTVTSINEDSLGIEKKITIKASIDFKNINYVFVVSKP